MDKHPWGAAPLRKRKPAKQSSQVQRTSRKYEMALKTVVGWHIEDLSRESVYAALKRLNFRWDGTHWVPKGTLPW